MAVEFEKLKFTRDWNNSSDFPTYEENEQKVRADMQALHDETKEFINETLIPSIENMAVPGTGDMKAEVYDPEGKRTNVYAYTDQKMVETTEALQSHADNRNNPHNVTAEQVMVTENVVNAMKQTGNWSVDGVLTQVGTMLLSEDATYRWQKTTETIEVTDTDYTRSENPFFNNSITLYYSSEVIINKDNSLTLVNPQTKSIGLAVSTTISFSGDNYFAFQKSGAELYRQTSQTSISTGSFNEGYGTAYYYRIGPMEKVSGNYTSELITSTDPNAHYDGEIDADGGVYTELDPIVSSFPRIMTGNYIGTGTYGASNPCSLSFSFVPKIVLLDGFKPSGGNYASFTTKLTVNANSLTTDFTAGTGFTHTSGAVYGKKSEDGKTVYWYNAAAGNQYNASDTTYYWVAIG